MRERPSCDTVGCGKKIPVGGEGHPQICQDCLDALRAERLRATKPGDIHDSPVVANYVCRCGQQIMRPGIMSHSYSGTHHSRSACSPMAEIKDDEPTEYPIYANGVGPSVAGHAILVEDTTGVHVLDKVEVFRRCSAAPIYEVALKRLRDGRFDEGNSTRHCVFMIAQKALDDGKAK